MIVLVPDHDTCPEVTSIDSTIELSLYLYIVIYPDCTVTTSLNVITRFEFGATPVASSPGERDENIGIVVSE